MGAIHDRSVYNGYKLQEDSPAINSGVYINDMPDADFFGNQIGLQPDIGAFESDTNETEFAFSIRTRGESPLLIKETKRQIRETPKDITAGEKTAYLREGFFFSGYFGRRKSECF